MIYVQYSSLLAHWLRLRVDVQPVAHDLGVNPYYVCIRPCKYVLVVAYKLCELLNKFLAQSFADFYDMARFVRIHLDVY